MHPFGIAFPSTTRGNRGTYQQMVQVGQPSSQCAGTKGEMIFPLGQSGFIPFAGPFNGGPPAVHTTTLHPIWADWRHVPMLQLGSSVANAGDGDGNGLVDAWECWYFDKTGVKATSRQNGPGDPDGDRLSNLEESLAGTDPTDGNMWYAIIDQIFRVRVTAVVESDERLMGTYPTEQVASPTMQRNATVIRRPRSFQFMARGGTTNVLYEWSDEAAYKRDDTQPIQALASSLARVHEGRKIRERRVGHAH